MAKKTLTIKLPKPLDPNRGEDVLNEITEQELLLKGGGRVVARSGRATSKTLSLKERVAEKDKALIKKK